MKKSVTSLFIGFVLMGVVSTTFAQKITLELVKGNGNAPAYTAPIPVTSAQYSFSNTFNFTSQSTGTGAGRATFAPMVITKQLDGSTAPLQTILFNGVPYQYVRLNFYRADGTLAYRVVMGTVVVGYYSASGAEGCTSGCPALSETINLEYGEVATYDPATNTIVRWSRVRNDASTPNIPESAIRP